MPWNSRGQRLADLPYDFSFSGMKSAVLNYINQAQMKGETDLCAGSVLPPSRMRWWMCWCAVPMAGGEGIRLR